MMKRYFKVICVLWVSLFLATTVGAFLTPMAGYRDMAVGMDDDEGGGDTNTPEKYLGRPGMFLAEHENPNDDGGGSGNE